MNTRIFTGSIFGACVLALAFGTGAAQATGTKTPEASNATAATNATSSNGESKATKHKHSQHHSASHNSSHVHHKHTASAPMGSDQETAYKAALRSCVEGPAGQRDNCLNGAIARFGRS